MGKREGEILMEYTFEEWCMINRYLRSLEVTFEYLNTMLRNPDYLKVAEEKLHSSAMDLNNRLAKEIAYMSELRTDIMNNLKSQ